jgi:hypothetical protein
LEEDEMKKLVEQNKKEKLEEKLARQRVREQIEQDKIARRAKFGGIAPTDGTQQQPEAGPVEQQHVTPASQPARDYVQTRLQVEICQHFA